MFTFCFLFWTSLFCLQSLDAFKASTVLWLLGITLTWSWWENISKPIKHVKTARESHVGARDPGEERWPFRVLSKHGLFEYMFFFFFLRSKISSKKRSGEESGRNHFVSFWKALPDLKLWISMSAWFSPVEKSTRETHNVSDIRIFGVLSQVPGSGSTWLWELAQVFILRKRTDPNLFWISCVQDWTCWTRGLSSTLLLILFVWSKLVSAVLSGKYTDATVFPIS